MHQELGETGAATMPVVRRVSAADVRAALRLGLRDFREAPAFGLIFGAVYAAGGLAIVLAVTLLGMVYLAYPLAAGFVLIAPFAATGLYEVSRRREAGEPLTPAAIFGAAWRQSGREMAWMSFVTLFIFIMWTYQTRMLMAVILGNQTISTLPELLTVLTTTTEGLVFLGIGHVVGAVLATILFSVTVVSFPLLIDRNVDVITAIITSVTAVTRNPVVMLGWAATIVALTVVAVLPAFLGLIVVLPVLGHATWHLYRRTVEPESEPRQTTIG